MEQFRLYTKSVPFAYSLKEEVFLKGDGSFLKGDGSFLKGDGSFLKRDGSFLKRDDSLEKSKNLFPTGKSN